MGANLSYPAVDLAGKVALVTGANTGIGYETAKTLAGLGAHTFVACRSKEKAAATVERMKAELEQDQREIKVEGTELDLASFRSTRECADAFKAKNLPLHLLINNAGVAFIQQLTMTSDNHETVFQVNHLSPLLLTLELLPTLLQSDGDSRVVWVASKTHSGGTWNPTNIDGEVSYNSMTFYQNSKLYNIMTAFNLQRRLENTGITISCLHPGVVKSDLWRHMSQSYNIGYSLFARLGKPFMRSIKDGAATTINCAVNPALNSQQCSYYSNCAPRQPSNTAMNEQYQEELWDISIQAIGQYLSPDVLEKYGASRLPSKTTAEGNSPPPVSTEEQAVTQQTNGEDHSPPK